MTNLIKSILKYLFLISVASFLFLQLQAEVALAKVDDTRMPAGQNPAAPVGECGDRNNSSCPNTVTYAATVTELGASSNASDSCPYCQTGDAGRREPTEPTNAHSSGGGTKGTGINNDTNSGN